MTLSEKIKNLPEKPGVYIMRNAGGEIIYIGKAVVLKNRVRQYFQHTEKPPKVQAMVDNIADFDYIIIDCPAGIEGGFHRAVSSATEALVVTTPHISSVRDADKVLSLLSTYNMIDIGLVVNRLRGDLVISGEMMSEGDISRLLRCKPMGVIPEDDLLLQSQADRAGRNSGSSAIAFNLLADNIENGNKRIYDCTARFRGFFSKIKLMMRNKV